MMQPRYGYNQYYCALDSTFFEAKLTQVPAPEDLKKLRLFKAFSFNNSRPIQGLLPVDHSIAYNPTGT